ncbi:MAG: CCA tRNA nucleotidyltransferase [Planctomycetes bacterium]|nr:CCA tRNA nucleotidyltransferase [Planctomycetota bacterium]
MTVHFPQRDFAADVVRQLRAAGHTALFAGGCVRDLLLGRPAKDYDVATTATPDQVRNLFGHKKTLPVGASFGVIIVLGPREAGPVEVATFRTEGPYHDGRRPVSVAFCTPEEDAQRRDFTINGMFYDPVDARVLDFVGGEADLAARVVRAIGDPHERVREDKLRMLRAVRFTAILEFTLDETTASAVREMASQLVVVSAERIAQELKKMLVDPHRRRAMELCDSVCLLPLILPELNRELRDDSAHELTLRMLALLDRPSFELALAALLHALPAKPVVYDICRRLKLSNEETDRITWLVGHQDDLANAPAQSLAQLKRTLAHPHRDELLSLLRVKLLAREADLQPVLFCDEYLARTPQSVIDPPPLITGDTLKTLGMPPSPAFKQLLETIRDAQLNDEIASPEQAVEMARRLKP